MNDVAEIWWKQDQRSTLKNQKCKEEVEEDKIDMVEEMKE